MLTTSNANLCPSQMYFQISSLQKSRLVLFTNERTMSLLTFDPYFEMDTVFGRGRGTLVHFINITATKKSVF